MADKPEKVDMVESGPDQLVKNIVIKPQQTELTLTWGIAVWTPGFTQFLHDYLRDLNTEKPESELSIMTIIFISWLDSNR